MDLCSVVDTRACLVCHGALHSLLVKQVGIGVKMHSGWGVLVGITHNAEVVDRRRIQVISADVNASHSGNQPYHYAAEVGALKGEKYLKEYVAETDRLAREEILRTHTELRHGGYEIVAAGLLLASGRKLPELPQILTSHPLIHTAEGELFRETIRRACETYGIPVLGLRERELEDSARKVLGASYSEIVRLIAAAGKSLGPPWVADHKGAALAALVALSTFDSGALKAQKQRGFGRSRLS